MPDKKPVNKLAFTADHLVRGVLTKLGDSFDKLTGRKWTPSSSLAASELIERIKKLLDAEAKEVPGKGTIVPHNLSLKMQWNKFSEDAEDALRTLEVELLAAAVDHINDSLYYTYAPVTLEVKPDYFIEGVKLTASFDDFVEDEGGVEMNVTVPTVNLVHEVAELDLKAASAGDTYVFHFAIKGEKKEKRLELRPGRSISVGRIGANSLVIDDASVSKTHASLVAGQDGALSVADTGSTNGTFINGERIAYGKAMRVEPDVKISFGTVGVTFEHVPRPIVIAESEAPTEQAEDSVSIDGFEFKRRVSPEPPPEEKSEAASPKVAAAESDTSPAIVMPKTPIVETAPPVNEIPDDTLKMEPDIVEQTPKPAAEGSHEDREPK